ncbi:MAG: LysE family translocator [Rhodobacteraceae bacterium]|nr:LysE family translocator [Paracoccaceae bacterium]MBR9820485.1 LysE family translocator [Paracoccaceae bacterium]
MIPHYLITVALIWSVAVITPGPNFLVVTRYSLAGERRIARAAVAGTVLGTFLWGLSGAFGLTLLFKTAPQVYLAVKVAGGLYILWLGLRILWQLPQERPPRPAGAGPTEGPAEDRTGKAGAQGGHLPRRVSLREAFRIGLFTNLANPKTALFVTSVFATALPGQPSLQQGVSAALLMALLSTLYYLVLTQLLTSARVARGYLAARRRIDAATGAIFLGFGAKLLLSAR